MHAPSNLLFWILFIAFVVLMLVLDLGVFNRKAHAIGMREALGWSTLWIALAGGFAVLLYFYGHRMTGDMAHANRQLSLEFITGYLVEEALSVDNLFVFLLIFRYFKVPSHLQHKVLFWGILGAVIMRALFIGAGVTLLNRFHWVMYLFGVFLVYAGIKLIFQDEESENPGDSFITRFAKNHLRLTDDFENGNFTTVRNGVRYFTKLALVLIVVETTDVVFAVDSIPAVLAVTRQPFIVFTSNIFAILGLRALYFALAGLMDLFHLLHYGLAAILVFIGVKMLAANYFEIPTVYALGTIVGVLALSVVLSLFVKPRQNARTAQ
ncbi:MAG TPA: TerC family protein [Candidatus Saccharimonadales bacterium]|nr:TerC family protein [Candidatus Saccharimonadales bacterium]